MLGSGLVRDGNIPVPLNASFGEDFNDLVRCVTGFSCWQNIVAEVVEEYQRVGIRIVACVRGVRDDMLNIRIQEGDRRYIGDLP